MYVCNTEDFDVSNALKHMKDGMSPEEINRLSARNDARRFPTILQVGMNKYRQLKNITSQEEMVPEARRKEPKHFINPATLTLHAKNCHHIKDHFLKAVLVNTKATGLVFCGHCMV